MWPVWLEASTDLQLLHLMQQDTHKPWENVRGGGKTVHNQVLLLNAGRVEEVDVEERMAGVRTSARSPI